MKMIYLKHQKKNENGISYKCFKKKNIEEMNNFVSKDSSSISNDS